ncbi:MAG: TAXI family TRAP transporter solute-binding subunit [Isosphaeraceae bacterium]
MDRPDENEAKVALVTDSSQKQARRCLREWVAAAFFVAAAGIGCLIYFQGQPSFRSELLITAGSSTGLRSQIARRLAQAAGTQGLTLKVQGSLGSIDALDKVDRGVLDLALVQGGLDPARHPRVRQVAAMYVEPLHLLVKPELHATVQRNLSSLRGKTVNLSVSGSGTHELARDVLQFAGLSPPLNGSSGDYQVMTASYQELESQIDSRNLPDAIFTVSALPSPLVRHLVVRRNYRLVALPFGEAFSLGSFDKTEAGRNPSGSADHDDVTRSRIYSTLIPAFTYGVEPPSPPEPLPTFGPRLLLVARASVPKQTVRLILEAIFSSEFSQYTRPALVPGLLDLAPEYPGHPGTAEYRAYHQPLQAGYVLDLLEKATSLSGAFAGALFCLWHWWRQYHRRRRDLGFETYMVRVAEVERKALDLEHRAMLDLKELLDLQVELNRLKNEAIARFAEGKLEGEALISGFIAHVNDARNYLNQLILHERENLEDRARFENRSSRELWHEKMGHGPEEIERATSQPG